ncbi:MAG: 2-oxoglutarate dehydrogenase complex dihydrolipoyllysine-residue succinyltransferase [Planctomycetota bacterium]
MPAEVKSVELKVPAMGESVTQVQVGDWYLPPGEWVEKDAAVVVLESDKATFELPAPVSGTVARVLKHKGDTAQVGEVIGYLEPAAKPRSPAAPPSAAAGSAHPGGATVPPRVMPAAERALIEHGLRLGDVAASGPGGRVLKEDVLRHVADQAAASAPLARPGPGAAAAAREEERVPMSSIRKRIAERLVQAQQQAALLTTFNELDMSAVMELRNEHRQRFEERHGIKLGFMAFFVKATIEALKLVPEMNAEIQGDEIVYHNYYDIGIAVGGGRGLVVPVLRNAERLSFAEIELAIGDFARRAKDNKLKLDELQGGTFTISNGGVYGSLLSTPIINPPQSGVLGLHAIQDRPVGRDGQIVLRAMMYVALTYDHRIVDGREAVAFLKRIKECIEQPSRILLEI